MSPSLVGGATPRLVPILAIGLLLAVTAGLRGATTAVGVPRADANSKLAHEDLVAKARRRGIDLYFVGDSITRRWGTSDAKYSQMLANWTANFRGWNAANFGWGADRIEHVLWRLSNGELDGVNPKVIVIQAGTNNVEREAADDARIADIATGMRAIIAVCREKAPRATIILTAIFPRGDNPGAMPTINRLNARFAALADGKAVRFLNVNERLVGPDGKLVTGLFVDGLHPTVQGYQVWADGLKPLLTELLGPPSLTDHAPPPTGDPSAKAK